jgi:hypothetical protein
MRALALLVLVTQVSCSLAFVPRPPRRGGRCSSVGRLAFPVADLGVAVAALSFGALRTFDPLCNTANPCPANHKEWSALAFGALVAAPFAVSSALGFSWRSECQDREPAPPPPSLDEPPA